MNETPHRGTWFPWSRIAGERKGMGSSTRWGRRPLERFAAVALLAAALVLNMATPLMAHPLDDDWSIGGDLIGYCGDSAGG